ncbi:MAG: hypothetical protein U0746_09555 [Gemmataceae bacterium]
MTLNDSFWDAWAGQMVLQSPAYAVIGCAFLFALIRRRRHPVASLLLMLGVALMMIETIATYAFYAWLTTNPPGVSSDPSEVMSWDHIVQLITGMLSAAAYALIFAAVFVERIRPYESDTGPAQPR